MIINTLLRHGFSQLHKKKGDLHILHYKVGHRKSLHRWCSITASGIKPNPQIEVSKKTRLECNRCGPNVGHGGYS